MSTNTTPLTTAIAATTTPPAEIAIPAFTITGVRATAVTNAAAAYNATQLKLSPQSIALTPAEYFQLQIENQQTVQASQEVIRQLKDAKTGPFVDAMLAAPASKRADLLAVASASTAA